MSPNYNSRFTRTNVELYRLICHSILKLVRKLTTHRCIQFMKAVRYILYPIVILEDLIFQNRSIKMVPREEKQVMTKAQKKYEIKQYAHCQVHTKKVSSSDEAAEPTGMGRKHGPGGEAQSPKMVCGLFVYLIDQSVAFQSVL